MRSFCFLIAIFLSFSFALGAQALEREKSVSDCAGEVVTVKGTVLLRQESEASKGPLALKPGNNVYAGDVINTGNDGAVKILMKDKSIVDLGGSALFKVASYKPKSGADREVELDMAFGKMRVAVSKKLQGAGKFQVKTRAATMGVRGTEFVVASDLETSSGSEKQAPPKTSVTVLQGKVDVANSTGSMPPVHLAAGNQLTTQVGTPSGAVVKLNDTQMTTVSSNSKVSDNTFVKAVTIESAPVQHASTAASNGNSSSGNSSRSPAEAGSSSSSGSASSSLAAVAVQIPTVSVSFSEIGVPGAPGVATVGQTASKSKTSYQVTVTVK